MGTKTQKLSNVVDQIVEWQSVFTGDGSTGLTAVAGRGYFIDTTSGTVTVTLPASPKAGDVVQLKDYARNWNTNAVTISSTTFDGSANSPSFSTKGQTVTLVYMDGTKGWSLINEDTTSELGVLYVAATGGTVTTSGDYKIHTFTGDGCFVVSCAGNSGGSNTVDYLIVAGGAGGGGGDSGGGGGAGGFRESSGTASGCYSVSPLGACVAALPVTSTSYPVTVGAGGAGGCTSLPDAQKKGQGGNNSVFSTITSAGGGGGGGGPSANPTPTVTGTSGGSGGGGASNPCGQPGGNGNTPPVNPPQGSNGGAGLANPAAWRVGGGGGGATENGAGGNPCSGGNGGTGATTSISTSPTTYSGGGGGGGHPSISPGVGGTGGSGGGGNGGGCGQTATAGTTNTGGGGGAGWAGSAAGSAGGKGIVILRYKFQN